MVDIQARTENPAIAERQTSLAERAATLAALSAVTLTACIAQRTGATNHLADPVELVAESMAHPIFGYVGGLVGAGLARFRRPATQRLVAVASTTAANFGAEVGQAMLVQIPGEGEFWAARQLPETAKDYGFALFGLGLYYFQHSRKRN